MIKPILTIKAECEKCERVVTEGLSKEVMTQERYLKVLDESKKSVGDAVHKFEEASKRFDYIIKQLRKGLR